MTSRSEVYEALDSERDYQDGHWNELTTSSGGNHAAPAWLTYIRRYLRVAEEHASVEAEPRSTELVMHDLRKIAAMCVCAMEQHGAPRRQPPGDSP